MHDLLHRLQVITGMTHDDSAVTLRISNVPDSFEFRCSHTTARPDSSVLPSFVGTAVIDHAVTTGQTECPISLEPFERPYIFEATGRSYSYKSFNDAVHKTLMNGRDLRVEDGKLLMPHQLKRIYLSPNFSLPGWKLTLHSPPIQRVQYCFDVLSTISFKSSEAAPVLPEMTRLLGMPLESGVCGNDAHKEAFEYYGRCRQEELTFLTNGRPDTVRNLTISDIVYPRAHETPSVSFVNVLFKNCVIYINCLCQITFITCRFEGCTVLQGSHDIKRNAFERCEFLACSLTSNKNAPYSVRKMFIELPYGRLDPCKYHSSALAGDAESELMLKATPAEIIREWCGK